MVLLWSFLIAVPAVALLLRSALRGNDGEKIAFVVNVMLLWLGAAVVFGYPGIILPALVLTAVVLVGLIVMTAADMLSPPRKEDIDASSAVADAQS